MISMGLKKAACECAMTYVVESGTALDAIRKLRTALGISFYEVLGAHRHPFDSSVPRFPLEYEDD